ncbi:MAG: DNA double-strand break repair nuclease NurA [Chloroflexi bacterium]|nr:DNA double-strand break repair nuclease NurA [Chloroflexota bacterium]
MALEFSKVYEQVQTMGRFLGHGYQSASNRLQHALELFFAHTELDPIHDRVRLVRESSVSGYRGAAPLPRPFSEIICGVGSAVAPPPEGTLLAVDGSQIYPDQHAPAPYYLINVGAFVYYHGVSRLPAQFSQPTLAYSPSALQDKDGRAVNNQTINARRSLAEMQTLALWGWELRQEARPLVALHDGGLLKFFGGSDIADAVQIERDYMDALERLHDAGASLLGYLDRSRSTYVISLLHLMRLNEGDITDDNLKTNGDLEGLTDARLFEHVLDPGERSAIMVQNSPQNREYKDRKGADFEIAFFYLNVSETRAVPNIVRIDLPLWVARDELAVEEIQALVLAQCTIQGRKRYPYALTRADELAYIRAGEKQQLEQLIRIEMLNNHVIPEESNKLMSKDMARDRKQQFRLRA